ncbi:YdeI/OmpD-associated family protein [Dyella silvatica]|uniref:YdeI/OmpD-associated family protein n=1 Tax=Dyella silvatica TaxID=2992128 RepID=UPI00224EF567|nr:YdeI/OmpD-associated family protein [Dyella silvatica]
MAGHHAGVDAYIAKSADFAKPILEYLRNVVHTACPETEETLKWGFPHFGYRGAMMCSMAAFKQHCSFGFWLAKEILDKGSRDDHEGMGQFGKITSLKDLPGKQKLVSFIKQAMALNEAGVKQKRPKSAPKPEAALPVDLADLLAQKKHLKAKTCFDRFSPSARRDYIEWITEAKTEATRHKRLATALEWLAEGKQRNWKYMA